MSGAWKPRLAPTTNLLALTLTNVEGFLVSRIDGNTSPEELGLLTGQSADQVSALLARLVSEGAVLAPPPATAAAAPPLPDPYEAAPLPGEEAPPTDEAPPTESPSEDEPPEVDATESNATHLKLYHEQFAPLAIDARCLAAGVAHGAHLSALCFDPVPAVIRNLLENPRAGPEQARLIAAHHPNAAGLEFLLNHRELMRDTQVQRLLFRNPQLNEGQLRRLTVAKRLLGLWKLAVSREATAQTRANTARLLRARFPTASAEERVELIFTTEGRALGGLSGLSIDGKTVSLLCARTYNSVMLVQSLAHWPTTPPQLILHLLKQPMVLRQPRLKQMLKQHPNAPSSAKGD